MVQPTDRTGRIAERAIGRCVYYRLAARELDQPRALRSASRPDRRRGRIPARGSGRLSRNLARRGRGGDAGAVPRRLHLRGRDRRAIGTADGHEPQDRRLLQLLCAVSAPLAAALLHGAADPLVRNRQRLQGDPAVPDRLADRHQRLDGRGSQRAAPARSGGADARCECAPDLPPRDPAKRAADDLHRPQDRPRGRVFHGGRGRVHRRQ